MIFIKKVGSRSKSKSKSGSWSGSRFKSKSGSLYWSRSGYGSGSRSRSWSLFGSLFWYKPGSLCRSGSGLSQFYTEQTNLINNCKHEDLPLLIPDITDHEALAYFELVLKL